MPVLFEIRSVDNRLLKLPEQAQPTEALYVKSYRAGKLSKLICGECLAGDVGGILHLVDDPWLIHLVNSGVDVHQILSEETAVAGLMPEVEPIRVPFTTKSDHQGDVALRHTFPEEPIVYN